MSSSADIFKELIEKDQELRRLREVVSTQSQSLELITSRYVDARDELSFITELMQGFFSGDLRLSTLAVEMYDRLCAKLGAFRGSITVYKGYDRRRLYELVGLLSDDPKREFRSYSSERIQRIALELESYLDSEVIAFQTFRKLGASGRMEAASRPYFSRTTLLKDLILQELTITNDVTWLSDKERQKALAASTGAFLNYGFDTPDGRRRVHMHFAFHDRTDFTAGQIHRSFATSISVLQLILELAAKNKELSHLSVTDPLTGAGNRRRLFTELERYNEFVRRYGDDYSLAMIDLDDFKRVNDTLGHACGDAILVLFVDLLRSEARDTDSLYRYGGEEFVMLYPHTDRVGVIAHLRRVASRFAQRSRDHHRGLCCSFSAGITSCDDSDRREPEELIEEADRLLYLSKRREGKRCVSFREDGIDVQVSLDDFS